MGVAGLWDVLKPAGVVRSLTDLAIRDGFQANPDKKRGFRLGIDASIWFFHAEYGREGENPVLRTLFFRCATLMHTTFLPLFVFDGPKRPDFKRGRKINKAGSALIPGMKNIVEAFGFEWRMAPGEAEAELAYLNRIGIIDGVLSDDVDNFLFGAKTVLRNSSNTLSGNRANPILNSAGKDDKNHSRIYSMENITNHPDIRLTQGGLILIGLMSGGDYQQGGLMRCGVTTAAALARCGFGDTLYEAAMNLDREVLQDFLVMWRQELKQELKTNSKGEIGRKQAALARSIPDTFPDINVLLSYVRPITSQSMGRESNNLKITWEREPDVAKLAGVCEMYFEWGYKEAIIKRFRTVMWHSVVLRILRRTVLDLDEKCGARRLGGANLASGSEPPGHTQEAPCGTPSKMIAKHFASIELSSQSKVYVSGSESEEEYEHRLIIKIHSVREHASTDGLLEYRLEVAPKQLVQLAESGIEGRRAPEGPDEWASEDDDDEGGKKRGKREPVNPESHLRLWMPACMVELVEPRLVDEFEGKQEQKRLKKVKKGTKGDASTNDKGKSTSRRKPPSKPASTNNRDENDPFSSSARPEARSKGKSKASLPVRSQQITDDDDDELPQYIASRASQAVLKTALPRKKQPSRALVVTDDELDEYDQHLIFDQALSRPSSSQNPGLPVADMLSSRSEVRDLTKKRNASLTSTATGLKSFFATTKSSTITTSKAISTKQMQKPESRETLAATSGSSALCSGETKARPGKSGSGGNEYDVTLWNKKIYADPSVVRSPTKRKTREKSVCLSSDSERSDCLKKSPKKKASQVSPKANRPLVSSSTLKTKAMVAVIEISSESDSDLPSSIIPFKPLPPLLRAKARVASGSVKTLSTTQFTTNHLQLDKRIVPTSVTDIIDLT